MTAKTPSLIAIAVMAVTVGCGGSDSSPPAGAPTAVAPTNSAASNDPTGKMAEKAAEVTSCLDLVSRKNWPAAVSACTKAAGIAPDNSEVQTALATAQQGLAAAGAADAQKNAADAANKAANDAAKSAMQDATKGLTGGTK